MNGVEIFASVILTAIYKICRAVAIGAVAYRLLDKEYGVLVIGLAAGLWGILELVKIGEA